MCAAKVRFIDQASGQERERIIQTVWTARTQREIVREAKRILDYWKGISEPRVIATLSVGQAVWQEVEQDGTT